MNTEPGFIGPRYLKALFREFTDTSFRFEKHRTPEYEHLGIMGPAVKAEVGDEIEIVFKNLASRPYSMHAHIVKTDKANEGTFYSDNANDGVPPKAFTVYRWHVPSGPGPNDPPCISSLYYSAHDQVRDLYSGLVGPIVICRKGVLDDNGHRKDVDKEFMVLFSIFDENESLYIEENINTYAPIRNRTNPRDPVFRESNMMHAINGYIYQAVPGLTMTVGERVAWHLLGFGSTKDVHTIHFHGQTVLYEHSGKHTQDVLDVFPESGASTVLQAINPGVWLLHCHVNDHMAAGMETSYTILPKGSNSFISNITSKEIGGKSQKNNESFDAQSSVNYNANISDVVNQNSENETETKEILHTKRLSGDARGDKIENVAPGINSKSEEINVTNNSSDFSNKMENNFDYNETEQMLTNSDNIKSPVQSSVLNTRNSSDIQNSSLSLPADTIKNTNKLFYPKDISVSKVTNKSLSIANISEESKLLPNEVLVTESTMTPQTDESATPRGMLNSTDVSN